MKSIFFSVPHQVVSAAALFILTTFTTGYVQAADCDRECLSNMISDYIDALVAHDTARLPLADSVRFTEDSQDLALGEGLWKTATAKGDFRQDYIDVRKQTAASHVLVLERNAQILYSVLLYVADKKITGIETLVQRVTPDSRFQPTMLGSPLKAMNGPVPAGQQMAREDMIRTALTYTEGLRIGSFVDAPTPFADEAYRVENGFFIAGEGCPREKCDGLYTQKIMLHPDVTASVAAVDEEMGTVLLWMNFGDTNSYGEGNALVTFEAFKVWGDKIQAINAFFHILPKATQRGWPSAE